MRVRLMIVVTGAVVGVAACGGGAQTDTGSSTGSSSSGGGPAGGPNTIVMKSFAFSPATLQVKTGTTVTWMNTDPTAHTSTADKSSAMPWDSGNLNQNQSFTVTFAKPGTYSFHCDIHNYMTGTVTVTG